MGAIPVFAYHSVSTVRQGDLGPYTITPDDFEAHLVHLVEQKYVTYTISGLLDALSTGALAERAVALTFDDGLADFHAQALPLLSRYRVASTLYVPTAYIGSDVGWLSAHPADRRPMLTEAQLRDVHGHGVECGAHTHTHPELDRLPASRVTGEVRRSKEVLEDVLNARVDTFSYPFGYHRRSVRNAVRSAGFESACAVGQMVADESVDRFAIPRLSISSTTTVPELRRLLERTESPTDRAVVQVKQVAWRWVRRARAGKALVQRRPNRHE